VSESTEHAARGLWANLRRRKVVQWGLAFAAAAWVVLQVLALLVESYEWPHAVMRIAFGLAVLGCMTAVVVAWYHGDKGQQGVTRQELVILTVLLLVGGGLLWRIEQARPTTVATPSVTPATGVPLPADDHSIAVLPFVNMSSDPEQDYFSDGLSEQLLDLLAKVPRLRVIARTSSFSFKGKEVDAATIARALNVSHLLEGSVRKSGQRLRVSAQLIRASDSSQLWSETYDRNLDDVFKVQDEIAQAVVQQLKVTILGARAPTATRTDPVQFADYLRARQLYRLGTASSLGQASVLLKGSLASAPTYAPAWQLLGRVHAEEAYFGFVPLHEGYAEARSALQRAVDIDPQNAPAIAGLASLQQDYDWNFPEAARALKLALALAPRDPTVLQAAGNLTLAIGDQERTCVIFEELVRLDPLNGRAWADLGYAYLMFGRYADAISATQHAVKLQPDAVHAHGPIGQAKLFLGDLSGAREEMRREVHPVIRQLGLSFVYAALGQRDAARQILVAVGRDHPDYAEKIAAGYAQLGDTDRAFAWLERAKVERDPGAVQLRVDRLLEPLHGDPRWKPLLARFGLSDEQVKALAFDIEVESSPAGAATNSTR